MSKLKDRIDQAKQTQSLAKPASTVLSIFQDERIKSQLQAALPAGGLTADRLLVVALNEIRRNPKLLDCTRESFVGALLLSAHLGLEVGGPLGHFYLVPFKNTKKNVSEITPILGYKGMIVLARRSGEISDISARAVFSNDVFEWQYGIEDRLVHRPAMLDRGSIVAFYGVARFTNGGHQLLVMSKADVDRYRARSRAKDDGPWVSDYEPMGAKTVIRRMSAFLPLTTEAAEAIAADEERELGLAPGEVLDLSDFGVARNGDAKKAPAAVEGGDAKTVEATGPAEGQAAEASDQPPSTAPAPASPTTLSSDPGAAFRR